MSGGPSTVFGVRNGVVQVVQTLPSGGVPDDGQSGDWWYLYPNTYRWNGSAWVLDVSERQPVPGVYEFPTANNCHKSRGWHGHADADGRCVDCGTKLPRHYGRDGLPQLHNSVSHPRQTRKGVLQK